MSRHLPPLAIDETRTADTVARCHARMAQHRRRLEASTRPSPRGAIFERVIVGGVSVIYLAAVAAIVLQVLMGA